MTKKELRDAFRKANKDWYNQYLECVRLHYLHVKACKKRVELAAKKNAAWKAFIAKGPS